MVRPVTFDRDRALAESMLLFWQNGYCSTSMQALGKQMNMHPGSLYGAFKSKRALFVEALELYFKMASETISERLSAGDTPLHGIRNFFDEIIEDIVSNKHTHGCLMINTATELAELEGNQSIRCRLNEMFLSHQKQFEQALFKAQEQGEISSDKDPVGLARYLLVGVRGLRVYGQGHPQREELEGVVKNMLAVLSAQ